MNDEQDSNAGNSDDGIQILKGMFPTVQVTTLRTALTSARSDINMAVDLIVCDNSVNNLDSAVDNNSISEENNGKEWIEDTRGPAEIIVEFHLLNKKTRSELINFNGMHRSLLQQLMKTYKNPQLGIQKSPDIHFEGELEADAGGPTKEYFYSAIESLFKVDPIFGASLFTGERGHLKFQS